MGNSICWKNFFLGKLTDNSNDAPPRKRHIPNLENIVFDKLGMLDEIKNKPTGSKV